MRKNCTNPSIKRGCTRLVSKDASEALIFDKIEYNLGHCALIDCLADF